MAKTSEPVDPRDVSPDTGRTRRIPPLVWIIVAILVAWFAIAMWQRQGTHPTASGRGTMTSEAEGPAYLPPAPASGSAPATPGGQVNGPQQPPASDAPR
ncbi:MAG: hypothetical protein ACJ798_05465 [Phenylobacterium sp.]